MKKIFKATSLFLVLSICMTVLSGCTNNKININGTDIAIDKNIFIKEDDKYYVDVNSFLEQRGFEKLSLEESNTYIINPGQIVSIDLNAMILIINGETIELNNIDYIEKDGEVYLNLDVYSNFFEENIEIDSKGRTMEILPKFIYKTSDELTLHNYFNDNYDKDNFGFVYNEALIEKAKENKVEIISEEEALEDNENYTFEGINKKIYKAYNLAVDYYDFYTHYQIYDWNTAIRNSSIMGGYTLLMNLIDFWQQVKELGCINDINSINKFTEKDLEYINRINTIISAIPDREILRMYTSIRIFDQKLRSYDDGGTGLSEIYTDTLMDAWINYEKAYYVYSNIKLPSYSHALSIVNDMRMIKSIKNSSSMEEESKNILKQLIEKVENNSYEELKGKYNEFGEFIDKLPEPWKEKLQPLEEDLMMYLPSLVQKVDKNGKVDIEQFTNSLEKINTSYNNMMEGVGVINNLFTLMQKTDYENFNFAESIDTGKVRALTGIIRTMLFSPLGENVKNILLPLGFSSTIDELEGIYDNVEMLINTVGGLVIMALADEVYYISDVFDDVTPIEKYINQ